MKALVLNALGHGLDVEDVKIRRRPGGGFKYSGVGREYGRYGIVAFLETRAILES